MHPIEKNIKDLDIIIPEMIPPMANYVPFKIVNDLVYVAGQGPIKDGKPVYVGKVGADLSEDEGIKAAELCCINIIAAVKTAIKGDWDRFDECIKLGGFVNCKTDFVNHPKIINGASDLLVKIFGDQGKHARFALGSNALPMDIAVEIDAIIKIR